MIETIQTPICKKHPIAQEVIEDILQLPYQKFVLALSHIASSSDTHKFLKWGIEHNIWNNSGFRSEIVAINVCDLIPVQNEIDIDKSLGFPLSSGIEIKEYLKETGIEVKGEDIVVFNGKYIMDGHHRWSQIFCINPSTSIECINLIRENTEPFDALKSVQMAIAFCDGLIPTETVSGTNLLYAKKEDITAAVLKHLSDDARQSFSELLELNSDESIASYVWNNASRMQTHNAAIIDAPNRGVMPQTDTPKENFKLVIDCLKNGII